MTIAREDHDMADHKAAASREWVRPTLQQLAAGSAEDSSGPDFDAIINPS